MRNPLKWCYYWVGWIIKNTLNVKVWMFVEKHIGHWAAWLFVYFSLSVKLKYFGKDWGIGCPWHRLLDGCPTGLTGWESRVIKPPPLILLHTQTQPCSWCHVYLICRASFTFMVNLWIKHWCRPQLTIVPYIVWLGLLASHAINLGSFLSKAACNVWLDWAFPL